MDAAFALKRSRSNRGVINVHTYLQPGYQTCPAFSSGPTESAECLIAGRRNIATRFDREDSVAFVVAAATAAATANVEKGTRVILKYDRRDSGSRLIFWN